MKRLLIFLSILLIVPTSAFAVSDIINPNAGWEANDILPSDPSIQGFNVSGNSVYTYADGTMKVYNKTTGAMVNNYGSPTGQGGWASFTTLDPSGTSAWVGFTNSGSDDYIWQVDFGTGTWTNKALLGGNFDMEFYGGQAYVSGLNSDDYFGSPENAIWLLDTISGSNMHDKIIAIGGNSAGLGIDQNTGDIYHVNYAGVGGNAQLRQFDRANIVGAEGTGVGDFIAWGAGTLLSETELGAWDTDIDSEGNVYFNGNGSGSYLALWDGTAGTGYNYDEIGTGQGTGYGDWFGFIDSEDGKIYMDDTYYAGGIAEISAVPIPGALWLLGSGLLGLIGIRKKKELLG